MSVLRISNLLRNNWSKIKTNFKHISDFEEIAYHFKRRDNNLIAFDGYNNCGALSLSTYGLLKKHNINCKIVRSKVGYGYNMNDHIYLQLDDIIIDPSYKQFMRDGRGYNDLYQNILYEQLEPFFVGSKEELFKKFENMIQLNKHFYKYENTNLDYVKLFYRKSKCVSKEFKAFLHLTKY